MRITVIGDLLYDHFIWAERLPRLGESVIGFKTGFYAGGKGGNQAVQAARLGAEVYMIGKVGKDAQGKFLIESAQKEGIHTDYIFEDPNENTGTCTVDIDRQGNNLIIVAPLANYRLTAQEVRSAKELIESSDILLSQLLVSEEALTEALRIAKAAGVTTVLNPAPAKEIPVEYYALADYLTPNETEAEFFTGCYQSEMPIDIWKQKVIEAFRSKGAKNLIVTLGAAGCLYSGTEGTFEVPPHQVKAVDTTAAGDAFNAAFCIGLASGKTICEALQQGNAAGALTASAYGSLPSMPTKEAVERLMQKG